MATKPLRAPNNHLLIAAGITLLLLAAFGAWRAAASNPYNIPVVPRMLMRGGSYAVLGAGLLFVSLRKSQFAAATATIIGTFLVFGVAFNVLVDVAFRSTHVSWSAAINLTINLAIAATILGSLLFPWNWSANKRVIGGMVITFAALSLLMISVAILSRL